MLAEGASHGVSMMARAPGVSGSGSCRRPEAGGGEDPWGPLEGAICAIRGEGGGRPGLRRVWARPTGDPKCAGFAVTTRHRVRRCMAGLGICGTCPDASKGTALPAPC